MKNDLLWNVLSQTLVRVSDYIKSRRDASKNNFENQIIDAFSQNKLFTESQELEVKHGPFSGMKYPQSKSIGSSLIAKLLGSYERELQPIIETICASKYTQIVDVGCAEGYYAVGLAIRIKDANIFAYDLNDEAITLCREMAIKNQVSNRVVTDLHCNPETLMSLPDSTKTLIISDCEGFEKTLFREDVVPYLSDCDILIETHDFIDIEISTELRKRFKDTHSITSILSSDDITKAHTYIYPELEGYNLAERKIILAEKRPSIMEWLYLTPQKRNSDNQMEENS